MGFIGLKTLQVSIGFWFCYKSMLWDSNAFKTTVRILKLLDSLLEGGGI